MDDTLIMILLRSPMTLHAWFMSKQVSNEATPSEKKEEANKGIDVSPRKKKNKDI